MPVKTEIICKLNSDAYQTITMNLLRILKSLLQTSGNCAQIKPRGLQSKTPRESD